MNYRVPLPYYVVGRLFDACPSPKVRPIAKRLICRLGSGEDLDSMITVVLHLLRLLPFLCRGYRQLALENLALHQQLAVYKANGDPAATTKN